ncbi:MAG: HAMP domain-containing histidine kinase [Clostridia bacterium]|nr:HAMP domain-containing histidine kinase [Clostridia bacterium]
MKKARENKPKFVISTKNRMRLVFVASTALVLLVALAIVYLTQYLLIDTKIITLGDDGMGVFWVVMFGIISVVIGLVVAYFMGRLVYGPINKLIEAMAKLSQGDYSVRLRFGKRNATNGLDESFNALATELQNTEILRTDFVNDFSHELKTPIASVNSLVSLMKTSKLSPEKQAQYLDIIQEEMTRLSEMTTKILDLSRVEKQAILTDTKRYNVSEQLRSCVLLLERKWSQKQLDLSLDFDEYEVLANEDLLKQVWINLIDNAIKYSTIQTELKITVEKTANAIAVTVINAGEEIPASERDKIFTKFYRSEKNQNRDGNGIGLSIVKHIVELHKGKIYVDCINGLTSFKVVLPQ